MMVPGYLEQCVLLSHHQTSALWATKGQDKAQCKFKRAPCFKLAWENEYKDLQNTNLKLLPCFLSIMNLEFMSETFPWTFSNFFGCKMLQRQDFSWKVFNFILLFLRRWLGKRPPLQDLSLKIIDSNFSWHWIQWEDYISMNLCSGLELTNKI